MPKIMRGVDGFGADAGIAFDNVQQTRSDADLINGLRPFRMAPSY